MILIEPMMNQVTKVPMPMQVFGSEFFWNAHRADVLRSLLIIDVISCSGKIIRHYLLAPTGARPDIIDVFQIKCHLIVLPF